MGYNKKIKRIVILFLILLFQQNTTLANIVYNKDDILITELELEEFKKIYLQNKKIELVKLKAIKELVINKAKWKTIINKTIIKNSNH